MQNSNVVNSQNEDYNKLSDEKLLELFKKKEWQNCFELFN